MQNINIGGHCWCCCCCCCMYCYWCKCRDGPFHVGSIKFKLYFYVNTKQTHTHAHTRTWLVRNDSWRVGEQEKAHHVEFSRWPNISAKSRSDVFHIRELAGGCVCVGMCVLALFSNSNQFYVGSLHWKSSRFRLHPSGEWRWLTISLGKVQLINESLRWCWSIWKFFLLQNIRWILANQLICNEVFPKSSLIFIFW